MTDPLHRPTDPLSTPRMTDGDIIRLWSWLLTDAVADPETRLGIAALLREIERARKAESQALKELEEVKDGGYSNTWYEDFD